MTSPVDTSVKFFNEGMPGAPVLNGVAGALIALFDACLITGFGLRACTITVASGVATVAVTSDVKNLNLADTVQTIAGVAGGMTGFADLNGEQKILPALTTTSLKFACPTVADGTATGTITIKQAPIPYWEKTYSTTNVACYRSTSPLTLGAFLRVDDTGTTTASVRMYETMSAHSTGTNVCPTVADATNTLWPKSSAANSTANLWDLFADSRRLIYAPVPNSGASPTVVAQGSYLFGEINAYKSIDPWAVWLGTTSTLGNAYGSVLYGQQGGISQGPTRILRPYTGLGVGAQVWALPLSGGASTISGLDNTWGAFPTIDGKIRLSRVVVTEGAVSSSLSTITRGLIPAVWHVSSTAGAFMFPRGTRIANEGRTLYALRCGSTFSETASTSGVGFVDITGPW